MNGWWKIIPKILPISKMQTLFPRVISVFMIIVTITHNFYIVGIYLISIILKDYNYMKNREI